MIQLDVCHFDREKEDELKAEGIIGNPFDKSKVELFDSEDLCYTIIPAWCKAHNVDYKCDLIYSELMSTGLSVYVPISKINSMIKLLGGNCRIINSNNKLYAYWVRNCLHWCF